jgi:hypothetical protein
MATTIYERFPCELVFYKVGTANDGRPILEQAPFIFVKVADKKNFVMPLSMDFRISRQRGSNFGTKSNLDIVGIQVLDKKAAIPFPNNGTAVGCQFIGDV